MSNINLTKKYVDQTLSNLDEFYIDPKKKIRIELDQTYELSVPEYLYCYYQTFPRLKMVLGAKTMAGSIISMFDRRRNFYPITLIFMFDGDWIKSVNYYDSNNDLVSRECFGNKCLAFGTVLEIMMNLKIHDTFTYIVFSISFRQHSKNIGHENVAIYEYNSVKKEVCSVYYEPYGNAHISDENKAIRDQLDNAMEKYFSCELISLPFKFYLQSIGFQVNLKDDIGFCVAISNLWLYVILNIIYSKSFNVGAKKIVERYKKYESKSSERKSGQPLIVMGNKRLLSSREKYLEKVKIQRREFLDSNFNTLSMCRWIQDVEKHIISYYNKHNNVLYNFLNMIVQYMTVNFSANIPITINVSGADFEGAFQHIFDESVNILMKTGDVGKADIKLENIPKEYRSPYLVNLSFLHRAIQMKYLKLVKLKNENEECMYDYDCEGNLECTNNICTNHD